MREHSTTPYCTNFIGVKLANVEMSGTAFGEKCRPHPHLPFASWRLSEKHKRTPAICLRETTP